MAIDLKTQNRMKKAGSSREKPSAYTTTGTVARVSGGVYYVVFDGSDIETPVSVSSVEVSRGDTVDVSVSHNDTRITGNRSDKAQTGTTVKQAVNAASAAASQAIEAVDAHVAVTDGMVELLAQKTTENGENIASLTVTAEKLEGKVEDVKGNVTTLTETATSLQSQITSANGDINTLTETATSLQSQITSANGDISILTQTAKGLTTTIKEAQDTANATATLIHEYSGGVLVCKSPSTVGALVNASGSFDIVTVDWDDDTPSAGSKIATFSENGIGGMWKDAFATATLTSPAADDYFKVSFYYSEVTLAEGDATLSSYSRFKDTSGYVSHTGNNYYPYVPMRCVANSRRFKMLGFDVNPSAKDNPTKTPILDTFWTTNGATKSEMPSSVKIRVQVLFLAKSALGYADDTDDS